ncbi:multicopper oxidase family protein [Arthrobacter cupressi]
MPRVSRRTALLLGGLGLAGTAAGATGLFLSRGSAPGTVAGTGLTQPPTVHSSSGRLEIRLEAAPGTVQLAGRPASCLAYNGAVPGPTLRVRAGDVLAVHLLNNLGEETNLHVHGLHVSPRDNGDNAFISVAPGSSFDYEYRVPEGHPPGVYWYHPHHHGRAASQVFGGLYGAIVVEDAAPAEVTRERVLVVSDITLDTAGSVSPPSMMDRMAGRTGTLLLVNGHFMPTIEARPGERELWRVINACVTRYLRLGFEGQSLQLLGVDSGPLREGKEVPEVLLAPGNRADLLVTAVSGESMVLAKPYDRGFSGGAMGPVDPGVRRPDGGTVLATVRVAGDPGPALKPLTTRSGPEDLRLLPLAARRQLVFGAGAMGMQGFTIDGKRFNPARTDITAAKGSLEEWTLFNNTPMDHPFHLHVWPMQIVEEDGTGTDSVRVQDVVNVPAGGSVKVRVAFTDFTGRTVYHCHILDHEDLGMMGVLEVR